MFFSKFLIICFCLIVYFLLLNYRYPNPSQFTYERRLFQPFDDALQSRACIEHTRMVVDKPMMPLEVFEPSKQGRKRSKKRPKKQVKPYEGPRCFIIPGNHGLC